MSVACMTMNWTGLVAFGSYRGLCVLKLRLSGGLNVCERTRFICVCIRRLSRVSHVIGTVDSAA